MKIRKKVEVIILKGATVCLIKNTMKDGTSFYGFPGGGIEEGDTALETCRKECLEEVGIAVKNIKSLHMTRRFPPVFVKAGRDVQWDGIDVSPYMADFDRVDRSIYGADHDAAKPEWYRVETAIKMVGANVKKPLAIIVKGNPLYLDRNRELADAFYGEVESILVSKGFEVRYDAGEPYTLPDRSADLWVAHSRGEDRLRFAPKDVKTLKLVTKAYDGDDPLHYQLNPEDLHHLQNLNMRSKYDFGGFRVDALNEVKRLLHAGTFTKPDNRVEVRGSAKWSHV
jgi:8-oxo-dGTP pyrophosphatase MutT (NUDIX family)